MNSTKRYGGTNTANYWEYLEKQMRQEAEAESTAAAAGYGCSDGYGVSLRNVHYILTMFVRKKRNLRAVVAAHSHNPSEYVSNRQQKMTTAVVGVDNGTNESVTTMQMTEHDGGKGHGAFVAADARVGDRNLKQRKTKGLTKNHGSDYATIGATEAEDAGHDYDSSPAEVEEALYCIEGIAHSLCLWQANVDDTSSICRQRTWLESNVEREASSCGYFWVGLVDKPKDN